MKQYGTALLAALLSFLASLLPSAAGAQVTIGSTGQAARAAILDLKTQSASAPQSITSDANVTSSAGGLILPRVRLLNPATLEPFIPAGDPDWINADVTGIKILHAGLTVYNLTTSNDFEPGFYSWDGNRWQISKATLRRGSNGISDDSDSLQIGGTIHKPAEIITDHSLAFEGAGEVKINVPLIVTGQFKYSAGSPGHQKLFLSDAAGNASWQNNNALQTTPSAVFSATGVDLSFSQNYSPYTSTGSSIVLPPGRWCIMVTMRAEVSHETGSHPDDRIWLRSTFIEEGKSSQDNAYFVDNNQLISGHVRPGKNIITGFVAMKNETGKPIRFLYSVGNLEYGGGQKVILHNFGSSMHEENSIVAFAVGQ
jgi:hypothetical protein